jgi:hypothetical protein
MNEIISLTREAFNNDITISLYVGALTGVGLTLAALKYAEYKYNKFAKRLDERTRSKESPLAKT